MDRASWSDPPEFVMIEIVRLIDSCFDIIRIRSVCTLCRSFVPSPFFCKKLLLFLLKFPWSIYECSFGWLVMIGDKTASIISSPKQSILLYPKPKEFNLMEFRVTEICKAYKLFRFVHTTSFDVIKTVVSSLDDFAICVLQYPKDMGFLKLGDEKWMLANTARNHYDDIVCYKGKLYAVDFSGKLVMFNSSRGLTEIVRPYALCTSHNMYLVESFGDLLLVEKFVSYIDDYGVFDAFQVYKLDEQKQCWVKVSSLEDVALFVARKCSFSVRAKDFSGNCIYFKRQDEEQTFFYNLTDEKSLPVTSLPCHSDVSWPPPNWC